LKETDEGISEEYIEKVSDKAANLIPEDFESLAAKIPVEGKDGERLAMVVTGVLRDGRLTEAYVAKINLEEKPIKESRIKKAFQKEEE